jgi:hypothetical protein
MMIMYLNRLYPAIWPATHTAVVNHDTNLNLINAERQIAADGKYEPIICIIMSNIDIIKQTVNHNVMPTIFRTNLYTLII